MGKIGKGWYPDPQAEKGFRWHDGTDFTGYTSELDPSYPVRAGWYPDPDDPTDNMMRYWDGSEWGQRATVDVVEAGAKAESLAYVTSRAVAEDPLSGEPPSPSGWATRLAWTIRAAVLLFGLGVAGLLMIFLLIALLSGDDEEEPTAQGTTSATAACVTAELDLAPGAPDPCASTTTDQATATVATGSSTTSTPPEDPGAPGRFTAGRILDPGRMDWAISYDYRIVDNHLTFTVTPNEDGLSGDVVGHGEVVHRNEYEAEQFPDSDKTGTVRRLFTAVTVFSFEGTWDGNDPGQIEGTVVWEQPPDRLKVEYNESTVGSYPRTDGIFSGPGPPGGVFTATWSPTTGEIEGEATVDPWGALTFEAPAFVLTP